MDNIKPDVNDILIIGGGPAGLTAGMYAARSRMKTLLIESFSVMGQATMTDHIENYPGIDSIGGFELISSFKEQAARFGLKIAQGTVEKLDVRVENGIPVWTVTYESVEEKAFSVICASGARPKKLAVPGESEFIGKGVSYCATCDGAFFRDKDIVVVGGGDTAVEEALFLTKFARKVTLVHRRDRLRATGILQERAFANGKMEFAWDSVVSEIKGVSKVEKVVLRNVKDGGLSELPCEGVFVFVGWIPNTSFLEGILDMDDGGAVKVDSAMKTSREGFFACGDCCRKLLKQVVTACGDGATAAFSAQHYVENLKGTAYK